MITQTGDFVSLATGGKFQWDIAESVGDFVSLATRGRFNTTYFGQLSIATKEDLLAILSSGGLHGEWALNYLQTDDIDLTGETCTPIGTGTTAFSGTYDGNGYAIYGLSISEGSSNYVGLFGAIAGAEITNVKLKTVGTIEGVNYVGVLCGYADSSSVIDSCNIVSGSVSGCGEAIGGLCGRNHGLIRECRTNCTVSGNTSGGGVCGYNGGTVTDCYAIGNVSAGTNAGGFCGENSGSLITCYSIGRVSGSSNVGGFCGDNGDTITNCFFLSMSGPDNDYGEPLTATELKDQSEFVGFDFVNIWRQDTYPALLWEDAARITPLVALQNLVANSETFQDAIGAIGTAAEKIVAAKLRIYLTAYEASTFVRPFALITKTGVDRNTRAGTRFFLPSGDLELRFESAAISDDPATTEDAFVVFYETVVEEMNALAATPGFLIVQSIDVSDGPGQYQDEDDNWYNVIKLTVSWGLG